MLKCLKMVLILCFALLHGLLSSRWAIAQYEVPLSIQGEAKQLIIAQYQAQPPFPGSGAVVDLEPPLIEHDVVAQAEADIRQTFVATVVDDEELGDVVLYYRFAGESNYSRYVMMRLSYSSTYIAQIPTDPANRNAIEYYIQASDSSGNRTVRGYTFSPLVREVVSPSVNEPPAAQVASQGAEEEKSGFGSSVPKAVYIVGGVLLLGLIASSVGGSSGSGSSASGEDCPAAGCRLTITANRPLVTVE